jgi:hypothetical protein
MRNSACSRQEMLDLLQAIESFPLGAANGTFPYYKLNRLTSANYDGRISEYSYDSTDNIRSVKTSYAISVTQ